MPKMLFEVFLNPKKSLSIQLLSNTKQEIITNGKREGTNLLTQNSMLFITEIPIYFTFVKNINTIKTRVIILNKSLTVLVIIIPPLT